MLPATVEPLPPLGRPTGAIASDDLLQAFEGHLTATGRGGQIYLEAAEDFLARWPDPHGWAELPKVR